MGEQPLAEDVWGQWLRDCYESGPVPITIRRDDGHCDTACFAGAYLAAPPEVEEELLGRLSGRVLDVGCGPGRHLLWLQQHGVEAVGIDVSPGAVEVARARGCRDVRLMDVHELGFPEDSFDGVVILGGNLNLGGTAEGLARMLGGLQRVVRPGGLLIGQGRDPLITSNPAHLAYHEVNRRAGRPPGQARVRVEYRGAASEWFWLLLPERDRLAGVLEATGWEGLEWHGEPDAAGYYVVARCRAKRG